MPSRGGGRQIDRMGRRSVQHPHAAARAKTHRWTEQQVGAAVAGTAPPLEATARVPAIPLSVIARRCPFPHLQRELLCEMSASGSNGQVLLARDPVPTRVDIALSIASAVSIGSAGQASRTNGFDTPFQPVYAIGASDRRFGNCVGLLQRVCDRRRHTRAFQQPLHDIDQAGKFPACVATD